jgi:hypothetical protein
MDPIDTAMHLKAGKVYGRESTCGKKMNFHTEETATKVAPRLSVRFGHQMEAYPCFWCEGWHIGREMTDEEREYFLTME